jgi:2-hydroxy-3-keto-5-methylthiopentenyl-1-phosphate phosphatase
MTASGLNYSASFTEKRFGKVSMLNGDGSVITTGTIVPVKQIMQYFGRKQTIIVLQIKSNDDGISYEQDEWIAKYDEQIERESIYASDPEASKAYAEKFQKEIDAARVAPSTPRPVRRTITRSPECEWF